MSSIDFSQYPVVEQLIKECDMDNERGHIVWLTMTQSDAAVLLAEMHLLCKAAMSSNIPLRKRSKTGANYYHSTTNNKIHVFASEQALSDFGMEEKDLAKLFPHKNPF
jgi:hypothetical protein